MLSSLSLIFIGFLFGFKHAFDADHIAAISALQTKSPSIKNALTRGLFWGIGHTMALFVIGLLVLGLQMQFSNRISNAFELIAALLLITIGIKALLGFSRTTHGKNMLIHTHMPFGLHSHPYPAFFVGIVHGLAGSAAALILAISVMKSVFLGLLYILIFGIGSIVGMAIVSLAIGFSAMRIKKYAELAAGLFSTLVGISMLLLRLKLF